MTEPRWITIDAVMALLHVSNGHARLLAHRHQWRRTRIAGRTHYLLTDILDTPTRPGT